ncbi:MAG TPA: dienelactone hydrolase family protein [Burkholderiales bacterium]|nr:dienelactone hydrolase family protein [Burkholderiales bacterium]
MGERPKLEDSHLESLLPKVPFDRRSFLVSSAASGFALSAGPLMAQTMIKTSMDGIEGGDIKIPATGGDMPGYYAAPAKPGRYPVILVVGEVWGAHEHIRDVVRRLAKAGYFAVANEPYWKLGDVAKMTDIKEVLATAFKLTDDQAFSDLDSTVRWAEQPKANVKRLGITGFCIGGRMVWMYASHNKNIDAGVAWYGNLTARGVQTATPIDVTDKLNAPVLGLYGGKDQGIPLEQVERLRAGLLAFGKDKESVIHVYPEAGHAFNADYRPSYRKAEADDGWKRMLAWFKKRGV